jgi:molybdopterin-containing oxidoreductase family iron-sulfur binding subunit
MVGVEDATWTVAGSPRVVAAFDADPLGTEGDTVRFARMYSRGRSAELEKEKALRLYVAEPHLSLTGANADHRLAVQGARVAGLLAAVAAALKAEGLDLPDLPVPEEARGSEWAKVLAEDLASRPRGTTLVVVGERQPPQVHALGHLINAALGNIGETLVFAERKRPEAGSVHDLQRAVTDGAISTLVMLGGNLAYDAPGDVPVADMLQKVETAVHVGGYVDETAKLADWHIPQSHYLETWGDLVARDGTVSIQQPLIAPLYESISTIEALSCLLGDEKKGHELVKATLEPMASGSFDKAWQKWLHDGVAGKRPSVTPSVSSRALSAAWAPGPVEEGFEVDFIRDPSVLDGRFGNSPWMQELPDPITKLTWDNAAIVSPATARKLKVETGNMVRVTHHDVTLTLPVWVQPGTAADVIALPIGYGREGAGKYAESGFSVAPLRLAASPFVLTGAAAEGTSKTYALASAQPETDLHGRPHIRQATRADFTEDENFVEKFEVMDEKHVQTLLWEEPFGKVDHKWGMTIDLNSCTGCSACTVACQAENNIPWVGKEEVMKGREMHWIRVDRYYEPGESEDDIEFKVQPLGCVHCETAPCENVCPVAATVHSPEGTNDMVYNRCIGTRYCSNNCPFKVRRFNFFHYAWRNDQEYGMGIAMQRNPNVTVRYRGVMEKCSYCMQRINAARIDAKVYGDGTIPDGAVTPACAQACPAEAITFGNLADEKSRVKQKASDPRNYAVLAELNIRPRTTYLARLTNPNSKLKTNG